MIQEIKVVLGFTGLDFTTAMDSKTSGTLHFVIKDHPTNIDRHATLLGKLSKSDLILSIDSNGKFSVSVKDQNEIIIP
jgi:hypothetical protein